MYRNQTIIDNPPGGNNNGRIDPGESAQLITALLNVGNQTAANLSARLHSGDPRLAVTDSLGSFGNILPCSTGSSTADQFALTASPSIPNETQVPCTLLVSGTSYTDTVCFPIIVGEIRAIDPIPDGPRTPPRYWAYDDGDVMYPEHPTFNWIEINSVGTQLSYSQNDAVVLLTLPSAFGPFKYYGQSYDQLSISADGWVCGGNYTTHNFTNTTLPNSSAPPGGICWNWDDLYPVSGSGGQGYVYYYHDVPNHRFIIEYDSVAYYDISSVRDKFEGIIYDTTVATPTGDNVLVAQYLTANNCGSTTIGLQDPTATIGIQCLYNGTYHRGTAAITPNRAIKYTTVFSSTPVEAELGRESRVVIRAAPNPFRNAVAFSLPANLAATSIGIYDNAGRLVRTVKLRSSTVSAWWNGCDELGRALTPGIYFYRIFSAQKEAGGKLILSR